MAPQGPDGLAGIAGPAGPVGPAGSPGLADWRGQNFYTYQDGYTALNYTNTMTSRSSRFAHRSRSSSSQVGRERRAVSGSSDLVDLLGPAEPLA